MRVNTLLLIEVLYRVFFMIQMIYYIHYYRSKENWVQVRDKGLWVHMVQIPGEIFTVQSLLESEPF